MAGTFCLFSHLHFDHVGDLNPFSAAQLVLGADAAEYMTSSYPQDPESYFQEFPKGQKVRYLNFSSAETNSIPLGPFHRAIDFFHDGSFYVIDAQGHFPGHLAALARTGPNQFVLLAGDCCHHRLCYNPGERLISSENHLARETANHLKAMHELGNVVVVLSHENETLDEMPLFPQKLNKWAEKGQGLISKEVLNLGVYLFTLFYCSISFGSEASEGWLV
jgi:glyoxylase-like metal-dependent hydrolase (beta-lactamase superfamily II)